MNIKYITIIMFLPLLAINCSDRKQDKRLSVITIKDFETDFNFKNIEFVPGEILKSRSDSGLQLYFQDIKEKKTIPFTLDKNYMLKRSDIDLNINEFFFETFFKSDDSIFQLKIGTKSIVLKNRKGDILHTYHLNTTFNPIIFPPANLKYGNNTFIMGNVSSSIGIGLKKDRFMYYRKVKPVLLAQLIDTTLLCIAISDFPEKYIATGNAYNDHLPSACIGNKSNICVSFGADDNLSLYHDSTLLMRKAVKSIYIDKFNPYPDEKLFDMLYLKNYSAEEPKYINVIYDQFENVYYRIVKHRHTNPRGIGAENTWSVIVTDTELKILGEVKFSGDYKYDIFIPTPLGIITAKRNPKQADKTILSLIKFKRNEN